MSRLTAGDIIPTVVIQPSASPITLNVQPAPGNILGGNSLQQLAQALGVATSGVTALGQAVVNQQNRQAVQQGEAIDFSDVIARGDNLNKSFKQIVSEMNLPDTANPYMLAAAESNFGSMVALKVRNGILSRMAELSDPNLDAASQSNLLRQIVAEETERWGGNRLAGNFYANNAFGSAVNEFLPGIEQQIGNEYLKNKESQALADLEAGLGEFFSVGAQDAATTDQFNQQFAGRLVELQRYTTDPTKVQGAIYRAAVTAFQTATTEEQIDNIYDSALSIPYGQKGTVADNWGMRLQLTAARTRAEEDMARRGDEEARKFSRNLATAERQMNGSGFVSQASTAIQEGRDPLPVLEEALNALGEEVDPAVRDALRERQMQRIAELSANYRSIGRANATQESNRIINNINSGIYQDVGQVIAAASAVNIDANPLIQVFEAYEGPAREVADSIPTQTQAVIRSLEQFHAEYASGARFDSLELFMTVNDEVKRRIDQFVQGETDLNGKTFAEIRAGGRNAAKAALVQKRTQIFNEVVKEQQERLKNASMVESERASLQSSTMSVIAERNNATTPQQKDKLVTRVLDEIQQSYAPLYDALGLRVSGYNGTFGDPQRVSSQLSQFISEQGPFTAKLQISRAVVGGSPAAYRTIKFDGNLYRIYSAGFDSTTGDISDTAQELAVFSREQFASFAINLKMQPVSGFSVQDVLSDNSGVMDIPFSTLVRRGFDWRNVPVFASMDEFVAMDSLTGFSEEQRQTFYRRVLGPQANEETIRAFNNAQLLLLDERELYRNKLR